MEISVHANVKSTKRGIFQQKTSKITNPVVVNTVLNSICKRFRDTAIRENFNPKLATQIKKTHPNNGGTYTHQ